MSTAVKKGKSFIKQFVAFVEGDDATVQAEKTYRQSVAALSSQISCLNGDTIDKETAVEDAEEALAKATVNGGQPITNRNKYVSELVAAKNNLNNRLDELEAHKDTVAFLEETLAKINS